MSIINFERGKTITGVLSGGERGKKIKLVTTSLDQHELDAIRHALDEDRWKRELHSRVYARK